MKNKWLREDLQKLEPYISVDEEFVLRLNANESPFSLPNIIKENFCDFIMHDEDLHYYPDSNCTKLRQKLSEINNVDFDNIICGVGSDQLIDVLIKALICPNEYVLAPNPSFSMYQITTNINHGNIAYYELGENFEYNKDSILAKAIDINPKIIFICNPNNPTGTIISKDDIIHILENTESLVVVDEAYVEFSENSMVQETKKYKNLLVLRTFSKAYQTAGLRMGYGIGDVEIIDALNIVKPPYNIPTMSQFMAIQILENRKIVQRNIDYLVEVRNDFSQKLSNLDFIEVYESHANYVFVKSTKELFLPLKKKKMLIRKITLDDKYYKGYDFVEYLRISIGTKEDMELLYNTIAKM